LAKSHKFYYNIYVRCVWYGYIMPRIIMSFATADLQPCLLTPTQHTAYSYESEAAPLIESPLLHRLGIAEPFIATTWPLAPRCSTTKRLGEGDIDRMETVPKLREKPLRCKCRLDPWRRCAQWRIRKGHRDLSHTCLDHHPSWDPCEENRGKEVRLGGEQWDPQRGVMSPLYSVHRWPSNSEPIYANDAWTQSS